jgi:hypothetical protein
VDAEVLVSTDYFDPLNYPGAATLNVAFLFVYSSPGPRIETVFTLDYTWGTGQTVIGPDNINPIGLEVSRGVSGRIDRGGFKNFSFGARANGSNLQVSYSTFAACRRRGLEVLNGGQLTCLSVLSPGVAAYTGGTAVLRTDTINTFAPGPAVSDFSPIATTSDGVGLNAFSGGVVWIDNTSTYTSSNPTINTQTTEGVVRVRFQPVIPAGILSPTSYTVATVPSAAAYPSHLIHVSNGDSGAPCLAVSNGTNWLRIPLGAAVST